jgi:hypothetical protein
MRRGSPLDLWSPMMRLLTFSFVAAAVLVAPALADPGAEDLDKLLDKAKKDKKYVAAVFTLYN